MPSALDHLNPVQREAVLQTDGPLLILAGAGSGKTRVLTHRVAHLIEQGVPPGAILAVTFTNKAANEMRERILKLVGPRAYECWIGTFHALCARLLRMEADRAGLPRDFLIFDDSDQMQLVKEEMKRLGIQPESTSPGALTPGAILGWISRAKEQLRRPRGYASPSLAHIADALLEPGPRLVFERGYDYSEALEKAGTIIYPEYQNALRRNKALDFDDLIVEAVRVLREIPEVGDYYKNRFRYVMVDEYQDINYAQYILVKSLAERHKNIAVVGDDDQSIYGWRGADVRIILAFEKDYPNAKVLKLEQNYRSTQTILDAAHSVVKQNESRRDKQMWTDRSGGRPITYYEAPDSREEADFVARTIAIAVRRKQRAFGDYAVLMRINAQSRELEEAFTRMGVPYILVGGARFYDRKEVKDLIAYLRVIQNPEDEHSLRRIVNVPARGIGPKTIQAFERYSEEMSVPLFEALEAAGSIEGIGPKVRGLLADFTRMVRSLGEVKEKLSIAGLLEEVINRTGYLAALKEDRSMEARAREENVRELVAKAREWRLQREKAPEGSPEADTTLRAFLEGIALLSDVDTLRETGEAVTVMTLHAAKGLEFPVIFMIGCAEGLLPLGRAVQSGQTSELEEERRLCYVGMTRARDELYLTYANRRMSWQGIEHLELSRFIRAIPDDLLAGTGTGRKVTRTGSSVGSFDPDRPDWSGGTSVRDMDVHSLVEQLKARKQGQFKPGDKVRHPKWGQGIVTESARIPDDEIVTAIFPGEVGKKKVSAKVAGLEKV
jgi:DNA helicase II / ATP-dependent DNA helicase PcrA